MNLVLPIPHFEWQILRAAKRNRKPITGRELRISPTRRTKDGSFLTLLVQRGLLAYATGNETAPFDATYVLTPQGEHAAEYGECEVVRTPQVTPKPSPAAKTKNKSKRARGE